MDINLTNRDLLELAAITRTQQIMGECPDCLQCRDRGWVIQAYYVVGDGWNSRRVLCPDCQVDP